MSTVPSNINIIILIRIWFPGFSWIIVFVPTLALVSGMHFNYPCASAVYGCVTDEDKKVDMISPGGGAETIHHIPQINNRVGIVLEYNYNWLNCKKTSNNVTMLQFMNPPQIIKICICE